MIAGKSFLRLGIMLLLGSLLGMSGCATPAFTKALQPPRKAPEHFSCGEDCPKSAKQARHAAGHGHDGHQH